MSISCLGLLLFGATLTFIFDYFPRLFLRTVPARWRQYRRRINDKMNPYTAWKPNNYYVDYGVDQLATSGEYDNT